MKAKNVKVIFDTNIWISFLIGKRLSSIKNYIASERITLIFSSQLLTELKITTSRDKLKKYFPPESVEELVDFLETIAVFVEVKQKNTTCRDPKDNFLLDLIESSNADFLVTGDKDLLALHPFLSASILTPSNFEIFLEE